MDQRPLLCCLAAMLKTRTAMNREATLDQNHQHHSFYSTPQNWPCLLTTIRVAMPSTTQSTSPSASGFCTEDLRKSPANSEYKLNMHLVVFEQRIYLNLFLGQREQTWCKEPWQTWMTKLLHSAISSWSWDLVTDHKLVLISHCPIEQGKTR